MPIISYPATRIASSDDISQAVTYFNSQPSAHPPYPSPANQFDGPPPRSETEPATPSPTLPAESAADHANVITTSHILLSRGVKDDPSLPNSACTSPTQQTRESPTRYPAHGLPVTTVWESTGKKIMTFGGAGGGNVKKERRTGSDELLGDVTRGLNRRSEDASRKASEWLGLTPRSAKTSTDIDRYNSMSFPDYNAERSFYKTWWPKQDGADKCTGCLNSDQRGVLPSRDNQLKRRDTSEDYEIHDLPPLSQPVASRIVGDLEERTSGLSYDSLEAQRSWPSISDFGDDVDNILPRRGRSLVRKDRVPNPFSRASSRNAKRDATIELNVRFMEPRLRRSDTFFDDPLDPEAKLEDKLLEPLPRGSVCASVNDVLSLEETPALQYQKRFSHTALETAYTFSTERSGSGASLSMNTTRKPSSAITSCLQSHRPSQAMVQEEKLEFILDTEKGIAEQLRSIPVSPIPYSARFKDKQPMPTIVVALTIPAEIMHNIYLHLGPVDFDAARHVCRLWYINSLEYSLLETMLRRGGWSSSVQRELATNRRLSKAVRINEEWLMSKHLARECALGPDWRGNGTILTACEEEAGMSQHHRHTPFKLCSRVDFRDAGVAGAIYTANNVDTCGMIFTVSSCSKFLMVSQGSIVYVYELNRSHRAYRGHDKLEGGAIRPFTSIICPRRVLACSMDTSSNRDAIAVLMDERMGLVCAVTGNSNRSGRATHMRDLRKMQEQSNIFPVSRGGSWRNNVSLGTSHSVRASGSRDQRLHVSVMASEERGSTGSGSAWSASGDEDDLEYRYSPPLNGSASFPKLEAMTYPMPIETSPPTLYALLCSADDPPRSVALCPQRRCVAFGCSSGIELHWVDALTGEDLNRWFPLTAPSDYLYFLPPRAGVDSAKKLRLVSSQGSPAERATISDRYWGHKKHSAFWGVEAGRKSFFSGADDADGIDSTTGRRRVRTASDHYRAVPLSDGYHLLFTDPASGVLCLGSDAPLGGPTKLLRKFWFSGPLGEGSPRAYAASSDLRWGVRVVAAYGVGPEQSIWVFSVPADVFADGVGRGDAVAAEGKSTAGNTSQNPPSGNSDWIHWWEAAGGGLSPWPHLGLGNGMSMMWPVRVRGQEIGHFTGLVDVAIHAGPDIGITVWAFGRQGVSQTWNIDGRGDCGVKTRSVLADGTVRDDVGEEDIEMPDVDDTFHPESRKGLATADTNMRGTETYDGALLSPEATGPSFKRRSWSEDDELEKDADGDVLMADLHHLEKEDSDSDGEQERSGHGPSLYEESWRAHGREQWGRRFSRYVDEEDEGYATSDQRGVQEADDEGRSWQEVIETNGQNTAFFEAAHRSQPRRGRRHANSGVDMVHELTGVARIDIEIR